MEGDLTWGGEHTIQHTDDVLKNCAPETYMILLTSVSPINFLKDYLGEFGPTRPSVHPSCGVSVECSKHPRTDSVWTCLDLPDQYKGMALLVPWLQFRGSSWALLVGLCALAPHAHRCAVWSHREHPSSLVPHGT